MKAVYLGLLSVFIVVFSCKKNTEGTPVKSVTEATSQKKKDSNILTEVDISKIKYIDYILDEKAEQLAESWENYFKLKEIIDLVKKADFSFFTGEQEEIYKFIKMLKKNVPQSLKTKSVLSRILVIETMLYKMHETYNLSSVKKDVFHEIVKDFLISFSNLNFQLNKKIEKDNQNIIKP